MNFCAVPFIVVNIWLMAYHFSYYQSLFWHIRKYECHGSAVTQLTLH